MDVLARPDEDSEVCFETQLCGAEKLYESLWDALKLALFTALHESLSGYLVYAAPESGWAREGQHPEVLFEDETIGVAELLHVRYPELWTACLRGTRTTRPVSLPFEIRTEPIVEAAISAPGSDWELRCVRIQGQAGYGWTTFDGDGWPMLAQADQPAAPAVTPEPPRRRQPPATPAARAPEPAGEAQPRAGEALAGTGSERGRRRQAAPHRGGGAVLGEQDPGLAQQPCGGQVAGMAVGIEERVQLPAAAGDAVRGHPPAPALQASPVGPKPELGPSLAIAPATGRRTDPARAREQRACPPSSPESRRPPAQRAGSVTGRPPIAMPSR